MKRGGKLLFVPALLRVKGLILVSHKRMPEAYRHISAALDQTSDEIASPVHDRARQILSRFQFDTKAAG